MATKTIMDFVRDYARYIFRFYFWNDVVCFFVLIYEMEQFKQKMARVFPFAFQPLARFSSSSVNAYHWVWKSKPLKLKLGALDLFVTGRSHFV